MCVMCAQVPFVKRSGAKFELTVRKREASNPAFSFLKPTHALHYLYRNALAKACGSVQEADSIVQESIRMYNESLGQTALASVASVTPACQTTSQAMPNIPDNLEQENGQVATEAGQVSKPAMIGPQNKPLVLKANPKVITRHQTDAVRAAQQAAAAIAAQAAASKAAAQQDGTAGIHADDASGQDAVRAAIMKAKQSVQTLGDVEHETSASGHQSRLRKKKRRHADGGGSATPSDASDSESGAGDESGGSQCKVSLEDDDGSSSSREDNSERGTETKSDAPRSRQDLGSHAAAAADEDRHGLASAGQRKDEEEFDQYEDPLAGVQIGGPAAGAQAEGVADFDLDPDLMLGDVPGGVAGSTLTDEDRARLAERRLKARSMLADKVRLWGFPCMLCHGGRHLVGQT